MKFRDIEGLLPMPTNNNMVDACKRHYRESRQLCVPDPETGELIRDPRIARKVLKQYRIAEIIGPDARIIPHTIKAAKKQAYRNRYARKRYNARKDIQLAAYDARVRLWHKQRGLCRVCGKVLDIDGMNAMGQCKNISDCA